MMIYPSLAYKKSQLKADLVYEYLYECSVT